MSGWHTFCWRYFLGWDKLLNLFLFRNLVLLHSLLVFLETLKLVHDGGLLYLSRGQIVDRLQIRLQSNSEEISAVWKSEGLRGLFPSYAGQIKKVGVSSCKSYPYSMRLPPKLLMKGVVEEVADISGGFLFQRGVKWPRILYLYIIVVNSLLHLRKVNKFITWPKILLGNTESTKYTF